MEWDLLKGLPEEWVGTMLTRSHRRRFARREVLFHAGDPAASVHLIAKGRVAIRVTTPLGDMVKAGPYVAMYPPEAPDYKPTAVAQTGFVNRIDIDDARVIFDYLSKSTAAMLAARVRQLNDRLLEALYVPADSRLLRRVLELTDLYGAAIPLTQEDLAGLAGVTRATVNRVLRREEKAGAVNLGRGRLVVVDREALARRAR